jgi:hypothetical protein
MRTGGGEPALGADHRRNNVLVYFDQDNERVTEQHGDPSQE